VPDYPPPDAESAKSVRAVTRLTAVLTLGAVAGVIAGLTAPWQTIPLVAWDASALAWILSVWFRISRFDAVSTSSHATADDPSRAATDVLLLTASVASLIAVVLGVIKAGTVHGGVKAVLLTGGILTIVVSWGMVHTLFTLRYAALYYAGPDGGIDFNEEDKPSYLDFAYVALTIGMTYQVSDTDLTNKAVRHTALRHAVLSYMFGTVIIAATINLAAGLVK
jgi:uncharacterized membrane protein